MAARDYGQELARLEHWNETLREALDKIYEQVEHANQFATPAASHTAVRLIHGFITSLRQRTDLPASASRNRAIQLLQTRWFEHMDDNSANAYTFSSGLASMAFAMGAITDEEARTYQERIRKCPVNGEHEPSRAWCAYCGTIYHTPSASDRIPMLCRTCNAAYDIPAARDAVGITDDERYGYCSEVCARVDVRRIQASELTR